LCIRREHAQRLHDLRQLGSGSAREWLRPGARGRARTGSSHYGRVRAGSPAARAREPHRGDTGATGLASAARCQRAAGRGLSESSNGRSRWPRERSAAAGNQPAGHAQSRAPFGSDHAPGHRAGHGPARNDSADDHAPSGNRSAGNHAAHDHSPSYAAGEQRLDAQG
jgi:hypothetical protein